MRYVLEFKCLDTSYYVASAHNQEDAQMILSSERKPHCYTFRGIPLASMP